MAWFMVLILVWPLVWLASWYEIVGLGWFYHGCDLIPESSCELLHYLDTYSKI